MHRNSLYKYFNERRWVDSFLRGELLFRSLAYFRDYEDTNVREDQNEGSSMYRPGGGLIVHNETQGTTFTLEGWGFESRVKQDEIFVFCTSRSFTDEIAKRFEAVSCVEITDIGLFCERVETALRPVGAKFLERAGNRTARIGRRVEYYRETDAASPRWALPEMIATSKRDIYAWQDEFRLVFSLTKALEFENVITQLVHYDNPRERPKPDEHHSHVVRAQSLQDICRVHDL